MIFLISRIYDVNIKFNNYCCNSILCLKNTIKYRETNLINIIEIIRKLDHVLFLRNQKMTSQEST